MAILIHLVAGLRCLTNPVRSPSATALNVFYDASLGTGIDTFLCQEYIGSETKMRDCSQIAVFKPSRAVETISCEGDVGRCFVVGINSFANCCGSPTVEGASSYANAY